ncbi:peptidoglycan recognition protein family protein [Bifidobacterium platyrrhinorum]|uniref:peptidoglycan recognition protein family protein n=1 Tax=Bifidobacterium platyrrhinorum TaxID=2661628 RepID=UPI001CDD828C|nr:peptidoglycan recognition family protein [Bifidobacterium platyrrhinorum]
MADFVNLQPDEYKLLNTHYSAGREGRTINKIVVHHNAGNLSIQGCWNVWQTRQASAHYQVDANGRIGQLVNDWDTAWHAGDWEANLTSIAIEHADINSSPWAVSDATLESGAHLVAALCRYYGLGRPTWMVNVFPHSAFSSTSCPASLAGSQNAAYMKRAQEWYDAMASGTQPGPAPSGTAQGGGEQHESEDNGTPARTLTTHVHYALRVLNGDWWPDVTDFGKNADGYAGAPMTQHDLLVAWVDKGQLRYRTHNLNGDWNDWVSKADKNDTVNGCAGIPGVPIDGVQMYYTTPDGMTMSQVYYRSQTADREGWLPVCCDDGSTYDAYDGWAGILGEPLDRLQLAISDGNPFA